MDDGGRCPADGERQRFVLLFRDEGGIRPFQLEPNEITREPRGKHVTVVDYPDGRLAIRYCGLDLPYTSRHLAPYERSRDKS